MVTVVVDAPLHLNDVPGRVGRNRVRAPRCAGLVVVDAHAGVVATWAVAAYFRGVQIGPGGDRLLDRALGAGISAGLFVDVSE